MNNTLIQYQGWRVHFLERWLHWEQSSPYIARLRIWRHLSLPGRILNGSVQSFRFETPGHPFLSPTYALSDRELPRLLLCPSVHGSCSFPSLWQTLVVNPWTLNFGLLKKEGAGTSRRSEGRMFKFLKGVVAGSGTGVKDLPYNIGEPYSSAWGSWFHYRGTSKVYSHVLGLSCEFSADVPVERCTLCAELLAQIEFWCCWRVSVFSMHRLIVRAF